VWSPGDKELEGRRAKEATDGANAGGQLGGSYATKVDAEAGRADDNSTTSQGAIATQRRFPPPVPESAGGVGPGTTESGHGDGATGSGTDAGHIPGSHRNRGSYHGRPHLGSKQQAYPRRLGRPNDAGMMSHQHFLMTARSTMVNAWPWAAERWRWQSDIETEATI